MKLLCKYYSNQVRLENSLQYLSTQPSFRFFCLSGIVIKNKKSFEVLTNDVTLIVACVLEGTGKNSMMILTSCDSMKDYDGKEISPDIISHDSVFYNLCVLLKEKASVSHNEVSISFKGDKMVATVDIADCYDDGIQCTIKGYNGDMVVRGQSNLKEVLSQCSHVCGFRHITKSEEEQREVIVSRGRASFLKEISRYLNRTLVLVSFLEDGSLLEQYISVSGLLEINTRDDGVRIYKKVQSNKLKDPTPFCVYHTVAKVDDIIREQGRALYTDKKN